MRLGFTSHAGTIEKMAEINSKLGAGFSWKKEEFIEAYTALSEVGFMRVGGEVASRNTQRAAKLDRSRAGRFLDKSTILFDTGEQFNRAMGYAASYRRWRNTNPKAKFDLEAQDLVLDMADTFSGNMTRVSNAAWQKGFFSIPTQFFAYQARIAELMLPEFLGGASRITTREKMQMFATYSVMYGVPTATGVGIGVLPFYDVVRERVLQEGFANPDSGSEAVDTVLFALHQGIVSTAFRQAGWGDVNFAQRYGPGGLDVFKDWYDGDKDLFEVLTGVSGSVIGDIWNNAMPLKTQLVNAFSGDPVSAPMLAMDLVNLTDNVSSLSALTRFYMGVTLRKYYTRNATLLNDQEQGFLESAITAMTGLTLIQTSDNFLKAKMVRIRKTAQREAISQIQEWLRIAYLSTTEDSFYKELLNRAGNLAMTVELNPRQIKQAIKRGTSGVSFDESVGISFAEQFAGQDSDKQDRLIKDAIRGQQGRQ